MIPAAVMDTLQVTVLVLVAGGALVVVRTRDRIRLTLMVSVYGILLAVLFLAFQAPDVTLSELTVGAVLLPLILLLAIAKVRQPDKRSGQQDQDGDEGQEQDLQRNEP
jgi:energy-converting hydrogenase B subunit D